VPTPPSASAGQLGRHLARALSEAGLESSGATEIVLREVAKALGAPLGALWSLDSETQLLRWEQDWGSTSATDDFRHVSRRLTFARGVGLVGRVLERLEPVAVEDVTRDPHFARAEVAQQAGLRWAVAVPVVAVEGATGVMEFLGPGGGVPAREQIEEVAMAGRQLAAFLARLRMEDRLRVSEEASASIVQAALDCIITMDHRGRVLDFNPAAEATFGYARADATGQLLADLIIPPEYREAHQRALGTYVREGRPTIMGQRLELVGMRADGSTLPVELTVTRVGTREPPVFAGFIRDIGERRALEAEQARLLEEAERARGRLAFLAQAGRDMAESMEWDATLRAVASVAIPALAEWTALTLLERGGELHVAAVAHRDPESESIAWELARRDAAAGADGGPAAVIAAGEPCVTRTMAVVPMRTGAGEIGAMTLAAGDSGRTYSADDLQLISSLAARAALHIQNARLYKERSHIARTLQASLRPRALPAVPGADVAARFLAAGDQNEVGGDFYDIFPVARDAWVTVVGDVSGKGAEAAAITALARHTLRTASMLHDDPAANLTLLNRAMMTQLEQRALCTLLYVRLCPVDGAGIGIRLANGGHPPPVVVRADGSLETSGAGSGPLVGAHTDARFEEGALHLDVGDMLVMYTDGVTEIRTTDPALGERELHATLAAYAGASSATVVEAVERRAVELQPGPPRDDIAVIAIRAV
jgi:PAS domain S-box-containing protein